LKSLGHDVVRVNEILPIDASDELIIEQARRDSRIILTQDLDFSRIIAVSGESAPSLISLRLTSSRIEYVHSLLSRVLPGLEAQSVEGAIITVEDATIRRRSLPIR
jgi:predicted nuclease of predicted toxin-antitoxin system